MTRISFAVTTLIFFNPFTNLWQRIIDHSLAANFNLFGLLVNLNIPFTGVVLLFLYVVLCWAVLSLLFWGLEEMLTRVASFSSFEEPVRHFRNRVLHSRTPAFMFWPELFARYVFWFIVLKFIIELIMQALLLTQLPAMLNGLVSTLSGSPSMNIPAILANLISSLWGDHNAQGLEIMLVTLSFILIQLRRFYLLEMDIRHFEDIRRIRFRKHSPIH